LCLDLLKAFLRKKIMVRKSLRQNTRAAPLTWTGELVRARQDYICFDEGGIEWTVHQRLLPYLSRELIPNWAELRTRAGVSIVKENRLRTVLRCPSAGDDLFIKLFRPKNLMGRAKNLVVPSKAMTEWLSAMRCYYNGLSTAQPAFVGERRRFGILETCTVAFFNVPSSRDYALVLDDARALPEQESDEARKDFAEKIAQLTHSLFQAGALHGDYHLGNLLVDRTGKFFVIDLNAVRFVSQTFAEQKLKIVSRIALSHAPFARAVREKSRSEVAWLCDAYAQLDPSMGSASELLDKVLEKAFSMESIRLKSRDKRCLVSSSLYEVGGTRARPIYRRRVVTIEDIEKAMKAPALEVLHKSARGRVEVIEAPESMAAIIGELRGTSKRPRTIVRKTIENRKLKTILDSAVRDSKGLRSWKAGRGLEVREIDTALMFALVEQKRAGLFTTESTLFMEHIRESWMVHHYIVEVLKNGPADGAPLKTRFRFIEELAQYLVRVQENGIRHHDLAVQNVLVKKNGDGGHDFFLIDLDTVRLTPLRRRDRIRNLVHFSDLPEQASTRDKLRFFMHYLDFGGKSLLESELKKWGRRGFIMEIARRLDERMAAKLERARLREKREGAS
jgi:tRNA A-37 threonylcarbamoyl transferase component Bud32